MTNPSDHVQAVTNRLAFISDSRGFWVGHKGWTRVGWSPWSPPVGGTRVGDQGGSPGLEAPFPYRFAGRLHCPIVPEAEHNCPAAPLAGSFVERHAWGAEGLSLRGTSVTPRLPRQLDPHHIIVPEPSGDVRCSYLAVEERGVIRLGRRLLGSLAHVADGPMTSAAQQTDDQEHRARRLHLRRPGARNLPPVPLAPMSRPATTMMTLLQHESRVSPAEVPEPTFGCSLDIVPRRHDRTLAPCSAEVSAVVEPGCVPDPQDDSRKGAH